MPAGRRKFGEDDSGRLRVCSPTPGELWAGAEGGATRDRDLPGRRHGLSRLVPWPSDGRAVEQHGCVFTVRKRIGRPVQ